MAFLFDSWVASGQANTDLKTGIAYGHISANALDPDVVHDLLYGADAEDLSYAEAEEEALNSIKIQAAELGFVEGSADYESYIDQQLSREMDNYICEEPKISGKYEGVTYRTSWLGGALNFWIFHSPHVTDDAGRASPCLPNAGILDAMGGGVQAYDVPADWRVNGD